MKILYNKIEFDAAGCYKLFPVKCDYCNNIIYRQKRYIKRNLKIYNKMYCSVQCAGKSNVTHMIKACSNCSKEVIRQQGQYKKSKNGNVFCNSSCAATYNNKNKTTGNRRSKLETWIETQLIKLFPNLDINFNDKAAINSELDIYIPSLNIAFEINGIFHYEPIYGIDKLSQIQSNDVSKSKACHDAKIDLCTIDTSGQKYFKPKTSKKYLDIITNIINDRLIN